MKLHPTLYKFPVCGKNYFSFQQREMCAECERDVFNLLEGMNELNNR